MSTAINPNLHVSSLHGSEVRKARREEILRRPAAKMHGPEIGDEAAELLCMHHSRTELRAMRRSPFQLLRSFNGLSGNGSPSLLDYEINR